MKSLIIPPLKTGLTSLSARRVWIEIRLIVTSMLCRLCHSPRGGCGLKYLMTSANFPQKKSLSARRVWIEIICHLQEFVVNRSLSARRVWIEILLKGVSGTGRSGHSPRGGCGLKCRTWCWRRRRRRSHSPRGGCGLKSVSVQEWQVWHMVTLREEGVD